MIRNKIFFSILLLFAAYECYSQFSVDTIYICFEENRPNMEKHLSFIKIYDENRNIKNKLVINFRIQENINVDKKRYIGYWFSFFYDERTQQEIELFGGKRSALLLKDLDFLKQIKPLDYQFFESTSYLEVCKTFEAEDSWEQDVVIFVIDKDEIKEGKLVLREVKFSRPTIE